MRALLSRLGNPGLGKVQSASFVRKAGYMVSAKRVTCSPSPPQFLFSGDVPRFSDQLNVHHQDDEGSSRVGDEGYPNENPSGDDATGYSKEEEEATSVSCEEFL
jgi:hypothetical protein